MENHELIIRVHFTFILYFNSPTYLHVRNINSMVDDFEFIYTVITLYNLLTFSYSFSAIPDCNTAEPHSIGSRTAKFE